MLTTHKSEFPNIWSLYSLDRAAAVSRLIGELHAIALFTVSDNYINPWPVKRNQCCKNCQIDDSTLQSLPIAGIPQLELARRKTTPSASLSAGWSHLIFD